MIRDLKPYVETSDSRVSWLGQIPSHWHVRRLRALVDIRTGAKDTIDQCADGKYPFFVRSQNVARIDTWSFDGEAVLTAGDGDVGKIFHYINGKFDFHQRVYKLSRFTSIQGKYFFHYFRSMFGHEVFQGTAKSTVESLRLPMLQNFPVLLPSKLEQTAIARFLDHTTSQIDRYIRAKQKLISLLEEQKQVIIHQAVTGQIDVRTGQPYPDYKPSGVEWLGEVPEHWEARRLGQIGHFFKGNGGTKADESKDGIPCIRYGDIYTKHQFFITESRSCVAADLAKSAYTPIEYGDVLFAASGETMEDIGKSAVNLIYTSACCGGDVIILRLSMDINPRYIGYAADCPASVQQKILMGRGFTVVHIYSRELKYLTISVPPLQEQAAIVKFLDNAIAKIIRIIDRTKSEIELLQEYRTCLISDVVTGKLDVREAAAELPQMDPKTHEDGVNSILSEQDSLTTRHDNGQKARP